jgi:hypothetical protein
LLATALTGCFSAPPQIISLEPNRGSTSVPADAPVRVVFDRTVTHASLPGRFTVTPSIPGCDFARVFAAPSTAPCSIHWLEDQPGFELLHLGAVFSPATRYQFTLAGGFTDPQGDRNGLDHHWDLTSAAAPVPASSTPADGAGEVALDAPLAVSFSAPMDAPSTTAAISLEPVVPGTRVVRNSTDHSRFVILPGRLLDPGIAYAIAVAGSARGEDGQFLAAAVGVNFTTGTHLESAHAVVLAGQPGEDSTEVLLAALAPGAGGEPVATPRLLRAPRCAVAGGCGAIPLDAPLQTYQSAAVAADGAHLAVVIRDAVTASSRLQVIDTVNDSIVADIPNGLRPSWSPDGTQLALETGTTVEALDVGSRRLSVVAADTALAGPPLWAGDTTLVLSVAGPSGAPASIELVNRALNARYAVPGAPAAASAVAVSPRGTRLAIATLDGAVLVTSAGGGPAPLTLAGRLDAVGFAGEAVLVAISHGSDVPQLVRISVVDGDSTTVTLAAVAPDLQSVRVAPDGRRLVCLAVDSSGVRQAYVADADGSGELAITRFALGGEEVQAVGFSD